MKHQLLFCALLATCQLLPAQTMRYFEVYHRGQQPNDEWRDSVYVVAASDPALLAEIETELSHPVAERKHLNGLIAPGDGGFNKNGDFRFSWHVKPNEWQFAEISIEACDGRAYSDVELDTAYWISNLGQYCGWAYCVLREIDVLAATPEPIGPMAELLPAAPNPADEETLFSWTQPTAAPVTLRVADALGRFSLTLPLGQQSAGSHSKTFATAALSSGNYFMWLEIGTNTRLSQQFLVAHP